MIVTLIQQAASWSDTAKNVCYGGGALMFGFGALKFFWNSEKQVGRIPAALERAAAASESSAQMVKILQDMHATQVDTENTLAVMAMEISDVKAALKETNRGESDGN